MPRKCEVELIQWPVGQGGFFTGEITVAASSFSYVFDCGSTRSEPLREAMADWESQNSKINLLFLSHLDADHVNGIDSLASRCSVEAAILPYLDLYAVALIIGRSLAEDTYNYSLVHFVTNPRTWFRDRGVPRVMYVNRAPPDEIPQVALPAPAGPRAPGEQARKIDLGDDTSDRGTLRVRIPGDSRSYETVLPGASSVTVLRSGSPFSIQLQRRVIWNLLPFVPPVSADRLTRFRRKLIEIGLIKPRQRNVGVDHILSFLRARARRKVLKQAYKEVSSDHNFVSMSLFSAPGGVRSVDSVCCNASVPMGPRLGWMSTGDAPLDDARVLEPWLAFYASILKRVNVFVVPHHGARKNTGGDVLAAMRLDAAVLPYGRANRYGHPHPAILRLLQSRRIHAASVTDEADTRFNIKCCLHF